MTKFRKINLENLGNESSLKKTKFTKVITGGYEVEETDLMPSVYKNVVHIGNDVIYGDVFIAYDSDPDYFTIYFGEAGDEFKNNGE